MSHLQTLKKELCCHRQQGRNWCPSYLDQRLEVHNEVALRRRLALVMVVPWREALRRVRRRFRKVRVEFWLAIYFNRQFISVGRSQSVGPTVTDGGSPKKQPKPMSASITAATASSAAKTHKKTPVSTPTVTADHQPRPSKLSSTKGKKTLREIKTFDDSI